VVVDVVWKAIIPEDAKKSIIVFYLALTGPPVAGFAAGLLQQPHFLDHHAAIDRLAHIVNRQQGNRGCGHRFHLDAGAADGLGDGLTGDGRSGCIDGEFDRDPCQRDGVAEWNQVTGTLGGLDGGDAGDPQYVTLLGIACAYQRQGFGFHADTPGRAGNALGFGLGTDIDHVGLAGGIEMREVVLRHLLTNPECTPRRTAGVTAIIDFMRKFRFYPTLTLLLLGLVPVAVAEGLPDLGESAQADFSPQMEKKIGETTMREIRQREPSYVDDPEINGYLNRLGRRLAAQTEERGQEFEFFALRDATLNAFAMPGGYIGVHTGLILAAQSESELASVLAHEISHVTQRHLARMVAQQSQGQLAAMLAMAAAILAARSNPDVAIGAAVAGQAGVIQNQLNYSRDFEREADRLGLQVLEKAGYDIRDMGSFFERLQKFGRLYENNAPGYLRTHPLTTERIADMGNRIQSRPYKQVPDSLEFTLVRAKLRAADGLPEDAVTDLELQLGERKFKSEPAIRYGLARAYLRSRNFSAAETQVAELRRLKVASPMVETLAAEIRTQQGDLAGAVRILREASVRHSQDRAVAYALAEALLADRRADEATKFLAADVQTHGTDFRARGLQAKAYAMQGKQLRQHWALGESYALQGQLFAAIEQLQLAQKSTDGDFYDRSQVDARLRQLKTQQAEELKQKKP
jgi:beta-barrel assembly-enhancing protease